MRRTSYRPHGSICAQSYRRHYHMTSHAPLRMHCHCLLICSVANANAEMDEESPISLQSLALQTRAFFSDFIGKDNLRSPAPLSSGPQMGRRDSHDNSDDTLHESAKIQNSIGVADFFSQDIVQIALHDSSISHQLLKLSEMQHCGESVDFLQKVYHPGAHSASLGANGCPCR